ncbi:M20 family metallopeptidase [bacterium]|nr:M20 family metallopeptidase [bacterium]
MPGQALEVQLLELTRQLMAIPSISSDRTQCHRALDWVIEQIGPLHGLTRHDFEYQGFRSVVFSTRPDRRSRLVLNAHLDVVPAQSAQFEAQIRGGQLWGRGSYDMKGAAAVYLQMVRDLAAMQPEDRPDVQVQFVTDEEIGGHRGAERLVPEGFVGDFVIAGEPTNLNICHAAKGVYWVTLHLEGSPGHAAMPWQTNNPLIRLGQGLQLLQQRYPAPVEPVWRTTATPTGVLAESSHNRVPDRVSLKLDIRRVPEHTQQQLAQELAECFPRARLEVVQDSYAHYVDPANPWCQKLADLQEHELGWRPEFYREHFASDARYWTNAGIPAVCWGPCGANMHADDEYLESDSLSTYHQLVARLVTSC